MLTLNDGRSELWQWDTGRKLTVDADCSQVHFSNKFFGRSVDVDVVNGTATIPDVLLQVDKELLAWAFVGTAKNGYTKISKVFKVNKRNKPADYVFTPAEQTTLDEIMERLDRIEESQDPDAIKNAVEDYLQNNPIHVDEKDPTVPVWARQPTKPKYTAKEVGAVATVNGIAPDENGNVQIPVSGGNVVQGGGMSATASALLVTILRNAMYSADQSANITALEAALASSGNGGGETETVTYTVTNNLTNVGTNNTNTVVVKNSPYTATLTAVDGYELETVTVFMGGVDITNTAHTNGFITIPQVTGNIIITATAVTSNIATEELTETVAITGWPELDADGKWAYTEGRMQTVAFLPVEIYGGTLTVEYNPEECIGFDISIRTAYADGKAAHTSSGTVPNVNWVVAGQDARTGRITASPTIYYIPDGDKAMVTVRRGGNTGSVVTSNASFIDWVMAGGIKCTASGKRG